jgi:hypothetical protein
MADQFIAAKQREAEALRAEIRLKTAQQALPAIPRSGKSGRRKLSQEPTQLPLITAPPAGNGEAAASSRRVANISPEEATLRLSVGGLIHQTHSEDGTLNLGAGGAAQPAQKDADQPEVASPSKHKLSVPRMRRLRVKLKMAARLMRLQAIEVPPFLIGRTATGDALPSQHLLLLPAKGGRQLTPALPLLPRRRRKRASGRSPCNGESSPPPCSR